MKRLRIRSALARASLSAQEEAPRQVAQPSPALERALYWRRRAEETCFPQLREAYRRLADSYLGSHGT